LIAGAAGLASARDGDVCEPSPGWRVPLRSIGSGATALGWLYATWGDGAGASRRVRVACLLASLLLVGAFLDGVDPARSASAPPPAAASSPPEMLAGDGFRWLAGCALAAHCAAAVLARAVGWTPRRADADADVRRLLLHAAGALLLLASAALSHMLSSAADSLCLGAEHLATAAFTASAWLIAHQPAAAPTEDGACDARGKAARGRAARREPPPPPPLLLDTNAGGVQGLASFYELLIQDTEGDQAHEFWEALADGAFRLILGGRAKSAAK
jgi:hypothetical protein